MYIDGAANFLTTGHKQHQQIADGRSPELVLRGLKKKEAFGHVLAPKMEILTTPFRRPLSLRALVCCIDLSGPGMRDSA